jgi:hypothetical protein
MVILICDFRFQVSDFRFAAGARSSQRRTSRATTSSSFVGMTSTWTRDGGALMRPLPILGRYQFIPDKEFLLRVNLETGEMLAATDKKE